jgi:archaellum component FlaG (FlaF/FlaG flagellin family)
MRDDLICLVVVVLVAALVAAIISTLMDQIEEALKLFFEIKEMLK